VKVGVRHDEVVFGDRALDVQVEFGKLPAQPVHVPDERIRSVPGSGFVLDVGGSQVLGRGLFGLVVVERLLVEGEHELLVLCCGHPVSPL